MNTEGERRPYRMSARAEAAAATGERILDAYIALFWERISDQITLDDVAARAGVTVQTVIRRFRNKEGVFAAALERETSRVAGQRNQAPPGDIPAAVTVLIEHYDEMGNAAMRLLAEEDRSPVVNLVIERARKAHWEWCEKVFEPYLSGISGEEQRLKLAQFVAICDVYTWKLLHHDAGLSRTQTRQAIIEMLTPLTEREI